MKKSIIVLLTVLLLTGMSTGVFATSMFGGDAADQASADSILDIVFAIDTSGSMWDDISAIGDAASDAITGMDCPDGDIWVRARFMGITGTRGIFDERVSSYVSAAGGVPVSNHSEDNGPAVTDLANWYDWNDDSSAGQDYYRAVVTIGDEGTENGQPVYQSDWDAAYAANQAAIANNVFLFSWITDDPYSGVPNLFETMAIGGTGGGHTFGNTHGTFIDGRGGIDVGATLEDIFCTAGSGGGGNPVPEPSTILLMGIGLLGLVGYSRKRSKKS